MQVLLWQNKISSSSCLCIAAMPLIKEHWLIGLPSDEIIIMQRLGACTFLKCSSNTLIPINYVMWSNIYSPSLLTINTPHFGSRAIGHFCTIQKLKIEIRKNCMELHVRYYSIWNIKCVIWVRYCIWRTSCKSIIEASKTCVLSKYGIRNGLPAAF